LAIGSGALRAVDDTDDHDDLAAAQGKLVVFLAAVLQRSNIVSSSEFGQLLGVFADTVAEAEPGAGNILGGWASAVKAMAPSHTV
jgi:hypothetical protein